MQPTSFSRAKIRALIAEGEYALADGPHPERARLDAEALLLHVLGKSISWLLAHSEEQLPNAEASRYNELLERRYR